MGCHGRKCKLQKPSGKGLSLRGVPLAGLGVEEEWQGVLSQGAKADTMIGPI